MAGALKLSPQGISINTGDSYFGLSLNALFIGIIFVLMLRYSEASKQREVNLLFLCFLILGPELLVYGGETRKDVLVVLALLLGALGAKEACRGRNMLLGASITFGLSMLLILYSRPAFLFFPVFCFVWLGLDMEGVLSGKQASNGINTQVLRFASLLITILLFASLPLIWNFK